MEDEQKKIEKTESPKTSDSPPPEFIDLFSNYYQKFFNSSADAVEGLADIQERYPKEYDGIRNFGQDPNAIEDIMESLPVEKQGVLLKILLKAGRFGKQMSNLFDIDSDEKRKLAKDLRIFGKELSKEIKETKNGE